MRLLIIDDHPMTCAGLRSLLQACYPGVQIDARHNTAGIADLAAVADYIFLDMHLPDSSFAAMLDTLHAFMARVILISAAPEPSAVALAKSRGARGLLLKNADVEQVLDGFRRIQAGETVFALSESGDGGAPSLTGRQQHVYEALLAGQSNKQIARSLGVTEYTVKEHVTAILSAFGVRNRLELVLSRQGR